MVDKAGATMSEVVSSIKRVTDIVGEISAASVEQSSGVAQVGEAISQMDQATQQNAALVEEMAAAASSLKSQAGELVQTVAVFKQGASASYHAAPPAAKMPAPPSPPTGERRGPDRAVNVARLKKPGLSATPAAPAKSNTEGDWASF